MSSDTNFIMFSRYTNFDKSTLRKRSASVCYVKNPFTRNIQNTEHIHGETLLNIICYCKRDIYVANTGGTIQKKK